MAEKKDEPKPWTPDQPLEDEDDEKETQRKARALARLEHLKKTYETPPKGKGERKSIFGG